ncbi:MAG TPA: permease [Sphingomonadaceae bacterium]|nr:permease [Sphingomonadaceae bacterium]
MSPEAANYVGFLGMGLIIAAYAYVTLAKAQNQFLYHGMNLVGAGLLVASLLVNTNLPALVLEAIWMVIALVGLTVALMKRGKA